MSTSLVFPFDSTGLSPKNLVENELRVVLPPAGIKDQSFIVPNAAAFFASSLVIKDSPNATGRVLREHVDYELSHYSVAASLATGKPCYGSITFIDRYYTGNVYLTYRSVGGDFSRFDHTWVEQQTKERYAMRHITFDQIVGVPSEFPTDIHTHKPEDMVGLSEVATGLSAIAAAIREANRADVTSFIAQLGNHLNSAGAHSPSQVGLGNLFNYKVATSADIDAQKFDRYVTASVLSAWVTGKLNALADTIPVVNLTNYYTKSEANDQFIDVAEFAQLTYTRTQIDDKIQQAVANSSLDLSGYAKKTDLVPYAKTTAVQTMIDDSAVDLSGYATKSELVPYAKKTDVSTAISEYTYNKTTIDGKVAVSAQQGNRLKRVANGLYVPPTDFSKINNTINALAGRVSNLEAVVQELKNSGGGGTGNWLGAVSWSASISAKPRYENDEPPSYQVIGEITMQTGYVQFIYNNVQDYGLYDTVVVRAGYGGASYDEVLDGELIVFEINKPSNYPDARVELVGPAPGTYQIVPATEASYSGGWYPIMRPADPNKIRILFDPHYLPAGKSMTINFYNN